MSQELDTPEELVALTPEHMLAALRRFWLVATLVLVATVGALIAVTVTSPRPYQATVTFSVQPPATSTNVNTPFLQFAVPVVQARLESAQLRGVVRRDVNAASGSFDVAVSSTPGSGLLQLTVSSDERELVQPALASYSDSIANYPQEAGLPISVNVLQPAVQAVQGALLSKLLIAGVEGLVVGLALAVVVALLLAATRSAGAREDELSRRHEIDTIVSVSRGSGNAFREDEFVLLAAHVRSHMRTDGSLALAVVPTTMAAGVSRSLVTAQLGRALAEAGVRVMIADADLRHPHLTEAMASVGVNITSEVPGHSQVRVMYTDVPDLMFVRGGDLNASTEDGAARYNAARVVSGTIGTVIDQARARRAVLLVDCPAAEGAAETHATLAVVDTALVVEGGSSRRNGDEDLDEVVSLSRRLGAEVIGLVVASRNRSERSSSGFRVAV